MDKYQEKREIKKNKKRLDKSQKIEYHQDIESWIKKQLSKCATI